MNGNDWVFLAVIMLHLGGCVLWGFYLGVAWCSCRMSKPPKDGGDK